MLYTLHELSGTSTHVISQRASRKDVAALVAEIVVGMYGGWKSVKSLWPVLLVAGGSLVSGNSSPPTTSATNSPT